RPAPALSLGRPKAVAEPGKGRRCPRCAQEEGGSRNKVGVPGGAARSPPLRSLSSAGANQAARGKSAQFGGNRFCRPPRVVRAQARVKSSGRRLRISRSREVGRTAAGGNPESCPATAYPGVR